MYLTEFTCTSFTPTAIWQAASRQAGPKYMLTGMQSVNLSIEVCIINEQQNINKHISEESPTSPHTDQMLFFGWVFFLAIHQHYMS